MIEHVPASASGPARGSAAGAGLDAELRAAHAAADHAALARLYAAAAERETDDLDAACFFLTHAWVFALSAGLDEADALRARLAAHGRV